jgi:hypothetical protein
MKKLFLSLSLALLSGIASAQAYSGKGDQKIQVGLNAWGYGTGIVGSYDYGLSKIVSIGAGANVFFSGYKDNNKDNNLFIFGRVNAHLQEPLNLPKEWDIYPGLDLGVLHSNFGIGAHIGVRYFFNNKVGVYGEFGNNGSLGVSFNF